MRARTKHMTRTSGYLLAMFLLQGLSVGLHAQTIPTQTVRINVPAAPGGPLEIVARNIAERIGARLGQSVIIENRARASGNIGVSDVSKAPPEGSNLLPTLGNTVTAHSILYSSIQFDLKPISIVTPATQSLEVCQSNPMKSLDDFVVWAWKNEPVACGHSGNGSPAYLVMENFRLKAGSRVTPLLYGGSAPLVNDLLVWQVHPQARSRRTTRARSKRAGCALNDSGSDRRNCPCGQMFGPTATAAYPHSS